MLTGVEYVRDICSKNKIPISTVEKECKFSNGYLNPKKLSKIPYDRALVLDKYFKSKNIYADLNLILGTELKETNENKPLLNTRDKKDIAKDMESIREKLMNKDDGPVSFDGNNIDDADAELFLDAIEMLLKRVKKINKVKYNPNKNKPEQ